MSLERIWKREIKRRKRTAAHVERSNRNWPSHAEKIVETFKEFAEIARRDGVGLSVDEPFWYDPELSRSNNFIGERFLGQTAVVLRFHFVLTGIVVVKRSEEEGGMSSELERGAQLIIHHSEHSGAVQVFLDRPWVEGERPKEESLLIDYTYNTDDLTRQWTEKQIARFLVFNRVESKMLRPSLLDRAKVRLWRFWDIRNRRGYLDSFQHLLTPWEMVLLTAVAFILGLYFGG